jgi:hypothetical protein
MSREIRRVPKNWNHPRKNNGSYKPLCDDYVGTLKYYKESVDDFLRYMTEIIKKGKVKVYDQVWEDPKQLWGYLTEDGQMNPPDIHEYMPNGKWYQLFEGVSEGTPLSPPFETKEELIEWLSNNKDYWDEVWTREQAQKMLESEYAPSGVMVDGKIYNSIESLDIKPIK